MFLFDLKRLHEKHDTVNSHKFIEDDYVAVILTKINIRQEGLSVEGQLPACQ